MGTANKKRTILCTIEPNGQVDVVFDGGYVTGREFKRIVKTMSVTRRRIVRAFNQEKRMTDRFKEKKGAPNVGK